MRWLQWVRLFKVPRSQNEKSQGFILHSSTLDKLQSSYGDQFTWCFESHILNIKKKKNYLPSNKMTVNSYSYCIHLFVSPTLASKIFYIIIHTLAVCNIIQRTVPEFSILFEWGFIYLIRAYLCDDRFRFISLRDRSRIVYKTICKFLLTQSPAEMLISCFNRTFRSEAI